LEQLGIRVHFDRRIFQRLGRHARNVLMLLIIGGMFSGCASGVHLPFWQRPAERVWLRIPWDRYGDPLPGGGKVESTEYWMVQTYDCHTSPSVDAVCFNLGWESARRAVDFYYVLPQQPGMLDASPWAGRGKNVRAAHSGTARRVSVADKCPDSRGSYILQITSIDGSYVTEYVHLLISGSLDPRKLDAGEEPVQQGQIIGSVSDIGGRCARSGPHLMFLVYRGSAEDRSNLVPLDDPNQVRLDGEVVLTGPCKILYSGNPEQGMVYRFGAFPRAGAYSAGSGPAHKTPGPSLDIPPKGAQSGIRAQCGGSSRSFTLNPIRILRSMVSPDNPPTRPGDLASR